MDAVSNRVDKIKKIRSILCFRPPPFFLLLCPAEVSSLKFLDTCAVGPISNYPNFRISESGSVPSGSDNWTFTVLVFRESHFVEFCSYNLCKVNIHINMLITQPLNVVPSLRICTFLILYELVLVGHL